MIRYKMNKGVFTDIVGGYISHDVTEMDITMASDQVMRSIPIMGREYLEPLRFDIETYDAGDIEVILELIGMVGKSNNVDILIEDTIGKVVNIGQYSSHNIHEVSGNGIDSWRISATFI